MVSLLKLAEITEEGVRFQNPYSAGARNIGKEDKAKAKDKDKDKDKDKGNNKDKSAEGEDKNKNKNKGKKQDQKEGEKEEKGEKEEEEVVEVDEADMMMLTPEQSIQCQNEIGADIMMQVSLEEIFIELCCYYSILVVSYVMWSGALDIPDLLL